MVTAHNSLDCLRGTGHTHQFGGPEAARCRKERSAASQRRLHPLDHISPALCVAIIFQKLSCKTMRGDVLTVSQEQVPSLFHRGQSRNNRDQASLWNAPRAVNRSPSIPFTITLGIARQIRPAAFLATVYRSARMTRGGRLEPWESQFEVAIRASAAAQLPGVRWAIQVPRALVLR